MFSFEYKHIKLRAQRFLLKKNLFLSLKLEVNWLEVRLQVLTTKIWTTSFGKNKMIPELIINCIRTRIVRDNNMYFG